ncbi:MAG TPA: site-2 protease family protein, partial [Bacillota bacterium]|nr:site-2 protease family protein [Bacillota bacterium]
KMGDSTPRMQGRLTLNPLSHLDPIGLIMMIMVGFGWAKPVQINPNEMHKFKRPTCMRLVAVAGVSANFILALISSILYTLVITLALSTKTGLDIVLSPNNEAFSGKLAIFLLAFLFQMIAEYNILLMAFNLIPIPPLDGFRLLETVVPYRHRSKLDKLAVYGRYILLGLIVLSYFMPFDILSLIINVIAYPARFIISLVTTLISSLIV